MCRARRRGRTGGRRLSGGGILCAVGNLGGSEIGGLLSLEGGSWLDLRGCLKEDLFSWRWGGAWRGLVGLFCSRLVGGGWKGILWRGSVRDADELPRMREWDGRLASRGRGGRGLLLRRGCGESVEACR